MDREDNAVGYVEEGEVHAIDSEKKDLRIRGEEEEVKRELNLGTKNLSLSWGGNRSVLWPKGKKYGFHGR